MLEAAFTLRLLHSPSSPLASVGFPFLSALQCCISLFSFHLFQHFHISCYSEFSSLAPSPSLKVQPSFLLSFLFLVVSDLYFLHPSLHSPQAVSKSTSLSRLLLNIGAGDPGATFRHCRRSRGAGHSQLQGETTINDRFSLFGDLIDN